MKANADAVLSAKSLHYFLQLVDSMSYTQASQILGITQPALTQQIKKLERAVGSPLFGQVGKKLYLTDAGSKMEETARTLFNTVHNTVDEIQQYTESDSGYISIGILNIFEPKVIEEFLIKFGKKYPDVRLIVNFYNREELWDKIDKNEIDFAILYIPDINANATTMRQFATKEINRESIILLSPKKNNALEDMLKEKWASYTEKSYLTHIFKRYYTSIIPQNEIKVRFSREKELVDFAQANGLNTFVTNSYYQAHQKDISLNPVKTQEVINFQGCFVYRKNKAQIPRLNNFLTEWNNFLDEKDYATRLDEPETFN